MSSSALDLAALKSSSQLSFASKSMASDALREYAELRAEMKSQFQNMLTDLRDKKTVFEADAGKIFNATA